MFGIFDKITEAIKDTLISFILSNLDTMFSDLNTKVNDIASQVGQNPKQWNSDIFDMIKSLSDDVILPIAAFVITFVLCYELISLVIDKNNMHDIDTFMFYKYFFKMVIAVFVVNHTFDIIMGIFEVSQHIVDNSATVINNTTSINIGSTLQEFETVLQEMGIGELLGLSLETFFVSFFMKIISVVIMVVIFMRMIEIYIYASVSPIPFATFGNKEWGQIGNNFLKGLIALGLQGFFIMVCVAIYAVLVKSLTVADDIHAAIWSIVGYTVVLVFSLFKTGSVSKSIMNAH